MSLTSDNCQWCGHPIVDGECCSAAARIRELEASNRRYAQQEAIHRIAARYTENTIEQVRDICRVFPTEDAASRILDILKEVGGDQVG